MGWATDRADLRPDRPSRPHSPLTATRNCKNHSIPKKRYAIGLKACPTEGRLPVLSGGCLQNGLEVRDDGQPSGTAAGQPDRTGRAIGLSYRFVLTVAAPGVGTRRVWKPDIPQRAGRPRWNRYYHGPARCLHPPTRTASTRNRKPIPAPWSVPNWRVGPQPPSRRAAERRGAKLLLTKIASRGRLTESSGRFAKSLSPNRHSHITGLANSKAFLTCARGFGLGCKELAEPLGGGEHGCVQP